MAEMNFDTTLSSLFKGMEGYISTKTVVGNAIMLEDGTCILPLVDVSFGIGAGVFNKESKNRAGGGMGGNLSPSAVLVIKDGTTRMISIKDQDTVSRILEMVPDVIARLKKDAKGKAADEEAIKTAEEILHGKEK